MWRKLGLIASPVRDGACSCAVEARTSQGRERNSPFGRSQDVKEPKTARKCWEKACTKESNSASVLWYGPASVRRRARLQPRLLVLGVSALVAGMTAAAGGADTPTSLQQRAAALRDQNASLAARSHTALLELYALESQLERARSRLDSLQAQAERIRRERASAQRQLAAAQATLRVSQRRLALRVRALYEQGDTDPLAAVLGATSLDEALTNLDDLSRAAALDRRVAGQAKSARASLVRLSQSLAERDAQVRSLAAAAEQSLAALNGAISERRGYLAELSSKQRLRAAQISQLESRARASVARADTLVAASPASPVDTTVSAPTAGVRTVVVVSTGYALAGRTSTGVPVGWGVVAVDPSVIPLGTRLTIPGYGEGVAADTGSAVQGAVIDLWFPSPTQALAWGRRTVTVTLH